jgi:hypothetical protein
MATDSNSATGPYSPDNNGALPAGQQHRAEQAHPNVNEPARDAEAGTPQYGDFGKPENATSTGSPASNDGSNDNPDEFSEFRKDDAPKTEDYSTNAENANPEHQRGHVVQNQDPSGVRNVQNADRDVQEGTWADDDERYAGGHKQASWQERNDDEHSND